MFGFWVCKPLWENFPTPTSTNKAVEQEDGHWKVMMEKSWWWWWWLLLSPTGRAIALACHIVLSAWSGSFLQRAWKMCYGIAQWGFFLGFYVKQHTKGHAIPHVHSGNLHGREDRRCLYTLSGIPCTLSLHHLITVLHGWSATCQCFKERPSPSPSLRSQGLNLGSLGSSEGLWGGLLNLQLGWHLM